MRKLGLISILLMFISISCTKKIERNEIIEISPDYFKEQKLKLSDYASDISYIQLDKSVMLKKIERRIIGNKYIFISAKDEGVLVYNKNGKFLNRIGKIGPGPGEYRNGNSFSIDTKTELVYIANGKLINVYNFKGKFLREFRMNKADIEISGLGMGMMEFKDDKLYGFAPLLIMGMMPQPHSWVISDTAGNILTTKKNYITFKDNNSITVLQASFYYEFDNKYHYWNHFNDTIFEINGLEFKPKYLFKDDHHRLKTDVFAGGGRTDIDKFMVLKSIYESSSNLYIVYKQNKKRTLCVYDKSKHEFLKQYLGKEVSDNGMLNDIDGGLPFTPSEYHIIDGNEYISQVVDAYDMKEFFESEEHIATEVKNLASQKKLNKMVDELSEEDNMIIMMCKLK